METETYLGKWDNFEKIFSKMRQLWKMNCFLESETFWETETYLENETFLEFFLGK